MRSTNTGEPLLKSEDEEVYVCEAVSGDGSQAHSTAYKIKSSFKQMGAGLKRLPVLAKNYPFFATWLSFMILINLLTAVAILLAVTVPPVGVFFAGLLIGSAKLVGASALVSGFSAVKTAALGVAMIGIVAQIANTFFAGVAKLLDMAVKAIRFSKTRKALLLEIKGGDFSIPIPDIRLSPMHSQAATNALIVSRLSDQPLIDLSKLPTLPPIPPPEIVNLVGQLEARDDFKALKQALSSSLTLEQASSLSSNSRLFAITERECRAGEELSRQLSGEASLEEKKSLIRKARKVLQKFEPTVEWKFLIKKENQQVGLRALIDEKTLGKEDREALKARLEEKLGFQLEISAIQLLNDDVSSFTLTNYNQLKQIAEFKPAAELQISLGK